MRVVGKVIAWLMMLVGTVWFLQGINVLPGSFMTGQSQWAVYGGLCWAAGIALVLICRRTGRPPKAT